MKPGNKAVQNVSGASCSVGKRFRRTVRVAQPPGTPQYRAIYSNSAENFKRPKNREDSSDLDENLSESIAAPKTFI